MSQIFHGRIKEMVRGSDLSTLSSKKIREQLEIEFKTDLSKRKKEIDDIVMSLLSGSGDDGSQGGASGDDKDDGDIEDDTPTVDQPRKRTKKSSSPSKPKRSKADDSTRDEELARMLQGEGGRRTRGKGHKEPKATKKKTTKRENSGTSIFKKDMVLSSELADIMGTNRMPTSKVVQRMWQIVKERDLRDPKNKQYHICDEQLLKVFGTRRVRTFSMMKYLKVHIKDPELLTNF